MTARRRGCWAIAALPQRSCTCTTCSRRIASACRPIPSPPRASAGWPSQPRRRATVTVGCCWAMLPTAPIPCARRWACGCWWWWTRRTRTRLPFTPPSACGPPPSRHLRCICHWRMHGNGARRIRARCICRWGTRHVSAAPHHTSPIASSTGRLTNAGNSPCRVAAASRVLRALRSVSMAAMSSSRPSNFAAAFIQSNWKSSK